MNEWESGAHGAHKGVFRAPAHFGTPLTESYTKENQIESSKKRNPIIIFRKRNSNLTLHTRNLIRPDSVPKRN